VYVRTVVRDLANVDAIGGTVDIDIMLFARWIDPSMVGKTRQQFTRTGEDTVSRDTLCSHSYLPG
jgi:hypothetical protein